MSEKQDRFDGYPVDCIIGELLEAEDTIARLKAENEELVEACRDAASEFVRLGKAHGIYCLATHSKLTAVLAKAKENPNE
jgi:hypothetical protein